jgi:AcrR family transcriptional regulator
MAIAIDCFARYGYQGTSIDRIASAAGVTKGALYYHFRDKEELLFEAVQVRIAEFEQRVVGAVSPATDPAGALAEIARVCVHIATKNNLRRFILTSSTRDTSTSLTRGPDATPATFARCFDSSASPSTRLARPGAPNWPPLPFESSVSAKLSRAVTTAISTSGYGPMVATRIPVWSGSTTS